MVNIQPFPPTYYLLTACFTQPHDHMHITELANTTIRMVLLIFHTFHTSVCAYKALSPSTGEILCPLFI